MESAWELVGWLIGEPGAAWIIGLLMLLVAVIGLVLRERRRESPARVVVQEVRRLKLLDIHASQQGSLAVFYIDDDGSQLPIFDLRQTEIVIYNDGTTDIIEPFDIVIRFSDSDSDFPVYDAFWRVSFDQGKCAAERLVEHLKILPRERFVSEERHESHGVRIKLPHLNSYPAHKDYVRAYLISDRDMGMRLWGRQSGRGWSARFITLDGTRRLQRQVGRGVLWVAAVLIGAFFLLKDRMPASEPGLRLVFSATLILGVFLLILHEWVTAAISRRVLGARLPSEFRPRGD